MANKADNPRQKPSPKGSLDTSWLLGAFGLIFLAVALAGVVVTRQIATSASSDSTPLSSERLDSEQLGSGLSGASQDPGGQTLSSEAAEASLKLELDATSFKISGFVADEETRALLEQATTAAYGELSTFDVNVDPDREGVSSIEGVARLPQSLIRLVAGSFSVSGDKLTIEGVASDAENKRELVEITENAGFTVDDQSTITDSPPADIRFVRTDGKLDIIGAVDSEEMAAIVTQVLVRDFGAKNVNADQLLVDPDSYSRFAVITSAATLKPIAAYGDFDVGLKNNVYEGTLPQGVAFESGSAELSAEEQAKVAVFPPLLLSVTDLDLTVTGHTDEIGDPASNQALSLRRAETLIDFYVSAGVAESRLTAVGKGSAEPIAPNDTPEGRAQNRRVTFRLN